MKELLILASLFLSGVLSESPAPYPPSGWRPNGPSFDLPQRAQALPQQNQQYLPGVDPRRPYYPTNFDDSMDVSVQGLPVMEQQPIFQVSPINGQLYNEPSINADISKLNPSFQQSQYRQQVEKARQFERQRQFDARYKPSSGLPNNQPPIQFASQPLSTTTTSTTTQKPELKTPVPDNTTEFDLNEGESVENSKDQNEKVTVVEISKQNVQEFHPELLLSPLSQLNLQPQYIPISQFGQLKAPIYYQPTQAAVQGFDGPAHLSALPSVLAQRELLAQQQQLQSQGFAQTPIIVQEQPALVQEPLSQYQPLISQYQPFQAQVKAFPLAQPQSVVIQPQAVNQLQPQPNQFPQQPGQFAQQPTQFSLQPTQYPQQTNQFPVQSGQYPQQPSQTPLQPGQFDQQPNQYPVQQGQYPQQPNQVPLQPDQISLPDPFAQQSAQFPTQHQQPNQFPESKDVEQIEQNDQQVLYQNYQPQFYQPVNPYQSPGQPLFLAQPGLINQNQLYQNPLVQYDQPQRQVYQDQIALQSGLAVDQGNGLEDDKGDTERDDEGSKATAVATAFGTRTQPRVFLKYGSPIPKVQANPEQTTVAAPEQPENEESPAIAQATAVASGRRNAKLRSRRIRPVFTLDRSGHLVLAQQQ